MTASVSRGALLIKCFTNLKKCFTMAVTSKIQPFATLINSLDRWEPCNIVKKSSNLDVTGLEIMFLGQKYMAVSHP